MLPILIKIAKRSDTNTISRATLSNNPAIISTSSAALWVVAAGVATSSFYRAKNNIVGFLLALSPLLFMAQDHLRPGFRASGMSRSDSWLFPLLVNTAWGSTLAASYATFIFVKLGSPRICPISCSCCCTAGRLHRSHTQDS